jgi:2-phospho-L-lactate guanylyltransferase
VIAAIVPVKDLAHSKSRLRLKFSDDEVERLAAAMLRDVVEALCRVPSLDRVVVATPDETVAEIARQSGAEVLVRSDSGLNPAVEAASREVAGDAGDGVLVVLGDVAGANPSDIERLVAAVDSPGVALAPSRDGGTAALLRIPRDAIAAGFGPDSAAVHRRRAERAGIRFVAVPLPSLDVDVDDAHDLERLLASSAPARHTRAVCRELGASGW